MQTLIKTKSQLYNCSNCYDTGLLSLACNAIHHTIYCKHCNLGRKLAVNSNNTNRRIH